MSTEPNDDPTRLDDMSISADALIQPQGSSYQQFSSIKGPIELETARPITASFDEFYRTHYDTVATALAVTLGSRELGREATDEAMTRAYSKWHMVAGYSNPSGWIYKVGLNWGRSWHRKVANRAAILRRQPAPNLVELPRTGDIELHDAMGRLDTKYRSVVVCRYLLDWSTDQTAEALDIRPGTVKSRLSAALLQLRGELESAAPEPTMSAEPPTPQQGHSS